MIKYQIISFDRSNDDDTMNLKLACPDNFTEVVFSFKDLKFKMSEPDENLQDTFLGVEYDMDVIRLTEFKEELTEERKQSLKIFSEELLHQFVLDVIRTINLIEPLESLDK